MLTQIYSTSTNHEEQMFNYDYLSTGKRNGTSTDQTSYIEFIKNMLAFLTM